MVKNDYVVKSVVRSIRAFIELIVSQVNHFAADIDSLNNKQIIAEAKMNKKIRKVWVIYESSIHENGIESATFA